MATSTSTRVGHALAKVLGIKLHYRNPTAANTTRGESVFSVSSADTFVEQEPSSAEWFRQIFPNFRQLGLWAYSLFPFVHWIDRYNVQWLYGDLVAGESFSQLPIGFDCSSRSHQESRLAALWSPNRWHTQRLPNYPCSLDCTRRSWAC